MLQNWLKPLSSDLIALTETLQGYQLGKKIRLYVNAEELPILTHAKAVVIGIDADAADAVRRHWYALSYPFEGFQIADLGNVRKNHPETIIPVLQELLTAGIIPILIGGNDKNLAYLLYSAYRHLDYVLSMAVVSNRMPYCIENSWQLQADYFLNRILAQPQHYLFNMSILAYQSHFTDPNVIAFLEKKSYEYLRLGKIKQNSEDSEPLLRDADTLAFDLAAIKCADSPATQSSPTGLTSEEACQIARYAGLSDKLSSFGLYNFSVQSDTTAQSAQIIAQIVWYFLDGVYNRKQDYPLMKQHFNQYLVDVKGERQPFIFWKSIRSERWWLQIQHITQERKARHFLFPCSYNDYLQATEGELSDRILLAFHRFG